ncbi:ABC-type transporter, integral membrane subunit [Caldalkalibacillus thermarum TA2.A1]|uniref:ABC-type transporter, integral membrane subunit n=1 Tax=Caldalkalibacillus thermarum (strain TA2.A1) TaxID=986075 RepID=F5LAT9_CALTT|nr:sugar ABC transporter permease [Caldalkalibacillus thermarum]EGL81478.1 ABC-type transporter, integral membrane subunit [Caldalkalibacillus thermarum TA2.A1]QZT33784.1 sugar ABC transporter permease [Caldalkalibacillus thermarum TA2.A1]
MNTQTTIEKIGFEKKEKSVQLTRNARRRELLRNLVAYSFISPWLIGFLGFVIGPMLASLYLSFTDYDMLSSPRWVGLDNYIYMFTSDDRFRTALKVTLIFVFISTPLKLAFALFIAMLMNMGYRGSGVYSTIYYVPSIIGGSVAVAVIWKQIFGREGAFNEFLGFFNVEGHNWIAHPDYALWVLILLVVWQFGSPMLIFLAGLRQIPNELYEAAAVDGANAVQRFFRITIPMLTPVIFFNLVMQMIGGFMTFTQSFLITGGGPLDRTLFYALYLYEKAFSHFQMGYASALAWVLLFIVALFTALIFKSSKAWVYYESEGGR